MRRNEDTGKKVLSVLMSAFLVGQMYFTPLQTAYAASGVAAGEVLTQEQAADDNDTDSQEPAADNNDGQTTGDNESGEQSDETTVNDEQSGEQSDETTGDSIQPNDESGSDAAQNNSGDAENNADASSQLGESNIMAVDLDSTNETYNEKADYREVTDGISVGIYKDSGYSQEVTDADSFTTDTTLYGKLNIDYSDAQKPSLSNPNIKYTFPKNVTFTNKAVQPLYDSNNKQAGTWYIQEGVAYLHYNEDWLRTNSNNITAHVSFDFTMAGNSQGDGKSVIVNFPGVATPVTINTKDGSVDASKFGADPSKTWEMPSFDATDNSYTWTIKVSPKTYATELVITDEIGSNLSFVDNSFKLVDKTGATVSGNLGVSYGSQKATISLGNLPAGDYYIQYKTQVKQSALDALKDNESLSNINNTIKWSWGTTNPQNGGPKSVDPQSVKYSMASKSASGTNDDITWTVTLNSGSLKADMSNYAFVDTLGDGQTFKSGTSYEVKDASGKTVASGTVDPSSTTLSFNLPSDAGKQQYTVTYHTQMTDTSSLDPVTNKVVVTPPADSKYPSGEATGTYQPTDKGTYITKSLTKAIDSASYSGVAEWKSQILFSDMAANTSADKIVFTDQFTSLPNNVTVKLTGDVTVAIDGGETLEAGTDYVLTDNGEKGQWNSIFQITFKATEKVKALIGKAGAKVNVTYKTQTSKVSDAYPVGTYTNESTLTTDKKSKVSASASFELESSAMPAVSKKTTGDSSWDATYDWGDGEKGAWITEWEVHVNCDEPNTWTHQAASDLKGADVKLTDTLPDGMAYVAKSGQYTLVGASGFNSLWNQAIEPTVTGSMAVFTVKTSDVATNSGTTESPVYSWKGYVTFKYKTAVKASALTAGESKEFQNSAQAEAGEKTFPAGTAKTTITNQVLDKTAARASDDSHVTFTINVNPNALTLGSTGSLELEDVMNSGASFTSGSLHVKDKATGDEVTDGVTYKLSNGTASDGSATTTLLLTVPDSRALVVTYDVSPQGLLGEKVFISNDVSMMGFASVSKKYGEYWQVAKSNAGTEGTSYGLTITKADDSGNKALEGAEFALYVVDLDNSTSKDDIKKSLVTGVGENPKTTGKDGTVTFGTKDAPLDANKLYCYVETKAPDGYKISNTEPSYVMFSGTSEQDKIDFAAALAKAKNLGITPTIGTSVNVYDSLADASFKIHINKGVSGSYKADAAPTFTFTATATGDNAELAPALSEISIKGAGEGDFEGTLTKEMIGQTFTYDLKEAKPETVPAGWTYDEHSVTATVVVDVNDDGKIVAEVSYSENGEAVSTAQFGNMYKAIGKATVNVAKQVNGANPAADAKFTFQISSDDPAAASKLPEATTVTTTGAAVASFGALAFNQEDADKTYTYTIKETGDLGSGWTKADDVTVTVKVGADKGDGTLKASTVEYSNPNAEGTAALFNNVYAATGKATIDVYKTVNGSATAKPDETFTFDLYEGEDTTGTKLDTVTLKTGETKSFQELTITEAGTKTYTVHEVGHNGNGWTAADDVTVTVTAKDKGDGTLDVTVTYSNGTNAAAFDNTYEEGTGFFQLNLEKTVNGAAPKTGETFEFSATSTDGGPTLANVTTDASGKASFAVAELGDADAGKTYHYTISEASNLDTTHWTKANDVTATVTVGTRGTDGKLPVTVKYSTGDTATYAAFDNTYTTTGSADIKVSKTVVGGTEAVKGEEFTFELVDAKNEVVSTVKATAGQTVTFPDVKYTTADAGKEFTYTVRETGHNDKGWTAQAETTATVNVTENADRSISATVEYGRGTGAATFTNTYATKGNATIEVYKTINGGTEAKEGEKFTFQLLDSQKKVVDTVETEAGNKVSFKNLEITGEGTWTYTVHETGHDSDAWFAASDVTVTVTAKDKGDGTLDVTVTYSNGTNVAAFDNTYAPASATLNVQKTVNGGSINSNEKFEFQLYKANESGEKEGDALQAVTVDGSKSTDGKASFGAIDYDKAGTSHYVITESSTLDGEHWTKAADVRVTVNVTRDATNKKLVAAVAYSNGTDAAKFNNTYTDTTSATLSVNKKVVGGTDATKDESFDFTLYEADGYAVDAQGNVTAGTQLGKTISVKADGTASFDALEYGIADAGKTFNYVIHEVGHRTDGWTAAADVTVKVEVVQGSDRSISTKVTYSNTNAEKTVALFTNAYAAEGEATISVYKTVNGGTEAKPGEKFTFDLYKADADGNAQGDKLGTVETQAGNKASFDNVKFDEAGTYYYVVKETGHNDRGWTAASDVKATVTVTDNGKGGLTASVTYSNTNEGAAGFDNTYEATGTATIQVEKTVNGGTEAAEGESFTFDLYKADKDGKATGDVIDTVEVKAGETASFSADKLGYTLADAGKTYKYVVHETGHNTDGWFAASDVTATVTVTDNNDGTLKAEVAYSNGTNAALFDNVKSTATAQLEVYKTVNGGDIAEGEKFTFALLDKDNNQVGDQKTCDVDNQVAAFDGLSFDKVGTYNYTIHETTELADGWTNDADVPVTVTVTRDEQAKKLVASVDYGERAYEKDGQVMAHFDDKYSTSANAGIEVSKTVNGGTEAVEGEWFEFELVGEGGKTVSTAKAQAGDTVAFEGVTYTTADAGKEFKYTIHEVGHNDRGWTADSDVDVTVRVTQNADRSLKVEREYSRGTNAAQFTNTYAASGEATISVYKTVNGGTEAKPGETFTFELFKADADGNVEGEKLGTVETKMGEVASFDDVKFDEAGTYHYVVKETGHNSDGWTAASDVKATVTVADNGDGTLTAGVEYSNAYGDNVAAAFDDTYEATGTATIQVEKIVNGGTEAAEGESFTFDLYEGDAAEGEPIDSVSVKADGTASFSALNYTFADAGKEFTYTVHETGHNTDGWVADSDVRASVKVTDNGDGTLAAEVTYSRGTNAAAFDDKYDTAATATISVTKTVNGGTEAVEGEWFEFELLDKDGNKVEGTQNVKTQADGTASFSALGYTLADAGKTFEYTVHEVGHNDRGWTADSDVDVTVKVVKNADLTLSTEVTYGRGTNAAEFTNTYATSGEATVQVYKTVNGGTEAKPGEVFTFELWEADANGEPLPQGCVDKVETKAGEVASFGALKLTEPGTWTYVVHETGHDGNGWTAASDVVATVSAVDNGDGTLTATVEYSNTAEGAAGFDDTYAAVGELEVKVSKTVNGGTYADDHEFEFGLFETDDSGAKIGDPISTVKVKAGQTAVLNGVFYDMDNAGETIAYVVSELGELGDGWTKAADQTVTVKVADNNDGTLAVDVAYEGGSSAAAFDNKYEQPTTPEQPKAEEKKRSAAPFTGDTANATFALVGAAGLALVALSLRRRRNDA